MITLSILCMTLSSPTLPQDTPAVQRQSLQVQARSVQARSVQARSIRNTVSPSPQEEGAPRSDGQASDDQDPATTQKATAVKDKNEVREILDSLEKVMGELKDSNHRVKNLKKVLVVLEGGKVEVGEEDKVKANKALRIVVITGLRSLRASARQIGSEIRITVLPKKRGLLSKLRARRELVTGKQDQVRYDRMIGQMNQEITLIEQQEGILQTNLKGLSAAIALMEGQLDFLDMVQESIQLGQKVGEQLRELNKELDQVVDRLVRSQLDQ